MSKFLLLALLTLGLVYLLMIAGCAVRQRKMLYFPSHDEPDPGLDAWVKDGVVIGYRKVPENPFVVWLMLHGNGGQASERIYALPCFSPQDALYVLEYPGYGGRPGKPSMDSLNTATGEAFRDLRDLHPDNPVCVVGESIGTGPASFLGTVKTPPEKIILVTPFNKLADVAADRLPYLPVRWLLRDNWDNARSLSDFTGQIEIIAAEDDRVISNRHARSLAGHLPQAEFQMIPGGHNDWSADGKVSFRYP